MPIWSPDSSRVSFLGGTRDIFGASQAYVVGVAGSTVQPLFPSLCGGDSISGLAWGRSGRLTFASTVNDAQVYRVAIDGSGVRTLAGSCAEERAPAWSPDGRSIAYERDREVFVMREDRSGKRRLAIRGAPTWSPSGDRIAFQSPAPRGALFSIGATGGAKRQLTTNQRDLYPDWSATVDRIAFMRTENKLAQVYTMRPDRSDQRRVTQLRGSVPAWSPDGQRLAYVFESNVCIIAPDGSDPKKLTTYDGCTEVSEPASSRDATTILFSIYSNDNEQSGIAFVPASAGPVRWPYAPPFTADDPNGDAMVATLRPGGPARRRPARSPRPRAQPITGASTPADRTKDHTRGYLLS